MKVSRQQAEQNRADLVIAARRLFRQHGFAGVSIAMIAKACGLTAGAFYSHFRSKREIELLAIASMIEKSAEDWRAVVTANPGAPLDALVGGYLAHDHVSEGDVGCTFVALGSDLARGDRAVRAAAGETLPLQIAVLESLFEGDNPDERNSKALAAYASLVGAATMARSIDDPQLVRRICESTAAQVLGMRRS